MKHFSGTITRLPLLFAILLLTAVFLLACGPVTQAEPQAQPTTQTVAHDSDADPTPTLTPTPTPTPEPPKYPNLDTFLRATGTKYEVKELIEAAELQVRPTPKVVAQGSDPDPTPTPTPTPTPEPPKYSDLVTLLRDIVAKYEAEELSETAAAAKTPVYHGSSVLVEVDLPTNIDVVYTWMGNQGISARYKDPEHIPPRIYSYVKVSLLGALSQQDGVTLVKPVEDRDGFFAASQGAGGASGGSSPDSTSEPKLPFWLKGYPYPKLEGNLEKLVHQYEQGELTAEEVASKFKVREGSSVHVDIQLPPDPANTDVVAAWLKSKGVSSLLVSKSEEYPNIISGFVPVSLMAELSQHPGVWRVKTPRGPGGGSKGGLSRSRTSQRSEQSGAPPTITPREQHEADHWNTAGYESGSVSCGAKKSTACIGKTQTESGPWSSKAQRAPWTRKAPCPSCACNYLTEH